MGDPIHAAAAVGCRTVSGVDRKATDALVEVVLVVQIFGSATFVQVPAPLQVNRKPSWQLALNER